MANFGGFLRDHQCLARLRLALDVFMFKRVHEDDLQKLNGDGVTNRWTMTMQTAPSGTPCRMSSPHLNEPRASPPGLRLKLRGIPWRWQVLPVGGLARSRGGNPASRPRGALVRVPAYCHLPIANGEPWPLQSGPTADRLIPERPVVWSLNQSSESGCSCLPPTDFQVRGAGRWITD